MEQNRSAKLNTIGTFECTQGRRLATPTSAPVPVPAVGAAGEAAFMKGRQQGDLPTPLLEFSETEEVRALPTTLRGARR